MGRLWAELVCDNMFNILKIIWSVSGGSLSTCWRRWHRCCQRRPSVSRPVRWGHRPSDLSSSVRTSSTEGEHLYVYYIYQYIKLKVNKFQSLEYIIFRKIYCSDLTIIPRREFLLNNHITTRTNIQHFEVPSWAAG